LDELGFLGTSVVECVNDENRPRARRYGANAVIRPARGYPEMLVRALVSPGSEVVLEEFFNAGGSEICRVDLNGIAHLEWKDVVSRITATGMGIPVGFVDGDEIKINPSLRTMCHTSTLYVIMEDQDRSTCQQVEDCLIEVKAQLAA
jgi:voltage-gated potassium channel